MDLERAQLESHPGVPHCSFGEALEGNDREGRLPDVCQSALFLLNLFAGLGDSPEIARLLETVELLIQ